MKLLYLDCGMGAAGDMLTAALLEAFTKGAALAVSVFLLWKQKNEGR